MTITLMIPNNIGPRNWHF